MKRNGREGGEWQLYVLGFIYVARGASHAANTKLLGWSFFWLARAAGSGGSEPLGLSAGGDALGRDGAL